MPHFYCIWFIFCVQCHQITFFALLECDEFLLLSVKKVSSFEFSLLFLGFKYPVSTVRVLP